MNEPLWGDNFDKFSGIIEKKKIGDNFGEQIVLGSKYVGYFWTILGIHLMILMIDLMNIDAFDWGRGPWVFGFPGSGPVSGRPELMLCRLQ